MGVGLGNKVCKECGEEKEFPLHFVKSKYKNPRKFWCLKCKNQDQRKKRAASHNRCTKKYEKTEKGYLVRTFRNMKSRVEGIQKSKAHLYQGLPLLSKEEFYAWSLSSNFPELLKDYENSGYDPKLAPSIDRISSDGGYLIGNIRWITHSKNSSLGAVSAKRYSKSI